MRRRRHKLQVSTFPFLAVLLCAMGSLILVLLVMDRKAHQAAQARARREAARLAEERAHDVAARQAERERLQQQARTAWEQKRDALHDKLTREQIEMQLQMRKVRKELQEIVARLHYEQDTSTQLRRKVQSERDRLRTEEQLLQTLRSRSEQTANYSKESSQTLRRMILDLLQMEQALKDLKASRKREQKTFSVVPYHGRHGENRRPLYVECTADGVIFHPERKAMSIASLVSGSDEPSSEVRAEVKRRIARQRAKLAKLPANEDKTPYLLLLLRPAGITTYHHFQQALKDLPVDFGYEFIDDDWILDFPDDDDQPSTQPWMIATKSPLPSPASSSSRTNNRPLARAPSGDPGVPSTGGIRGSRTGARGGTGNGVRGSPTGGPGGTGHSMPSGRAGGVRPPLTVNRGRTSPARQLYPQVLGNEGRSSTGGGGESGRGGSESGIGVGTSRGNGLGNPTALAPSFRDGGGNMGISGDGPPGGSDFRGSATFNRGGSSMGKGAGYSMGSAPNAGGSGSSDTDGSDFPGLGPPRALPSTSGDGYGRSGSGENGIVGTGVPGNGVPGNGMTSNSIPGNGMTGAGYSGNGVSGNRMAGRGRTGTNIPGFPAGTGGSADGRYGTAHGINGGGGSGQAHNLSGGGTGTGNTRTLGSGGTSPVLSGSQLSGSQAPLGNEGNGSNPPMHGSAGSSSGTQPVMGGRPGTQTAGGTPAPANGSGSSDKVVFVDPLTGQPTNPPRPTPPPPEGADEERPPETDGKRKPRIRVIMKNGGGGSSDPVAEAMNRIAPTPTAGPRKHKPAAVRPAWIHGGRDWIIYIECRADSLVLYPYQKVFALSQILKDPYGNPLTKTIQNMIARRQALRRKGEPPYRPQLCLLVRPEHIRTFLTVDPALEALPVPRTRRNLDADDDVIDIINGASP